MTVAKKLLEGVIPALLIPFREDGSVDHGLLEKQVEYLVSKGVQGIFINGSTGESAYVSTEEKAEIVQTVIRVARGRTKLCAACIQPSTEQTLKEIKVMEKLEPDFIVAVTPYYFKVDQSIILEHYRAIAAASPVPVIAYDIPSCTHNKIHLETILRITEIPNIVGLKDSSGDFITFCRAISQSVQEGFSWIQGDDYLDAASFLMGAQGIVTGTGNVWIDPYLELYQAIQGGNHQKALDCQRRINALCEIFQVVGGKVIPGIKAATYLLRRSHRWMRQQAMTLNEEEIAKVRSVLVRLGLL
ncbi:MAG: dihydrodipicolinate synthase family protein [Spirochaetes bacterium]|nr:dihydrodipicolinate synthase family protein [Spirochaetota bacterium]